MQMLDKSIQQNPAMKNHKQRRLVFLVLIGIGSLCGCKSFLQPRIEKEVHVMSIPKNQLDVLKKRILDEGYEIIGKEDFPWEGAICTNYAKKISINTINASVQVLLSYKNSDTSPDFYRNLGLSVVNLDRPDLPEVKSEVTRMDTILYEQLREIAGKENVKRGNQ
jgi:hypothetical protein